MSKILKQTKHKTKFSKIVITEKLDGFWLYDYLESWHIANREETETKALLKAIEYYQKENINLKDELRELKNKVNSFIGSLDNKEDYFDICQCEEH